MTAIRSPSYQLLSALAAWTVSQELARMAKMMKTVTVRTVTTRPEKRPLLVPWQSAYCKGVLVYHLKKVSRATWHFHRNMHL